MPKSENDVEDVDEDDVEEADSSTMIIAIAVGLFVVAITIIVC